MTGGRPFDIRPAGMLALDVARVEAGLLLIDVDFHSSKKALIDVADVLAVRDGPRPARAARQAARSSAARRSPTKRRGGRQRRSSASRSAGPPSSGCTTSSAWRRRLPAAASRVAVPVYKDGRQVGRATTTTWSPVLKKLIALATIDAPHFAEGTRRSSSRSPSKRSATACRRPSSRRRSSIPAAEQTASDGRAVRSSTCRIRVHERDSGNPAAD